MTDTVNEKTVDFASDTAGEFWAEVKAKHGDDVSIDDVQGTGAEGAIKKGDITEYLELMELSMDDEQDEAQEPVVEDEPEDEIEGDVEQEVEAVEGKTIENLTDNTFDLEGTQIKPRGTVKMTDELSVSQRLKHAIDTGVLAVK